MVSDFYGRVDWVLEAFFVPTRLCWGGWQDFMTHPTAGPQYPEATPLALKPKTIPQVYISSTVFPKDLIGPATLADYLGCKGTSDVTLSSPAAWQFSALPFIAYHRIWHDWYRDSRIQTPVFGSPRLGQTSSGNDSSTISLVSSLPYVSAVNPSGDTYGVSDIDDSSPSSGGKFIDGVNILSLRQRNWSKDYFTSASLLPQSGNASTLTFDVASDDTGTFSISALRAANSLQKWMERNNIAGYRYSDQIYAQYGIYPSDAIMDRPLYLGRTTQNVYTRSVFQTSPSDGGSNPLGSVASKYGSSQSIGEGSLVDKFRASEHGFLIVLASLVPHAYYSSGTRRMLSQRKTVSDIAFPLLSGMGDQSIRQDELGGMPNSSTFGYTDLYAEYKYHDDEVHGLLVDGSSLEQFALQRSFPIGASLGSEFLQIPTDFMKQVLAVPSATSGFDCWYDIYFPYKKISTLPEYSLPTLADLKNTHTVHMSRGGKRL